jgi:hypothetical protein
MIGSVVVLCRKLPLGAIPGRWQVGFADLPASAESITPGVWWIHRVATAGPVVMDSGLRSLRSRPRNDGVEQFVTQ